MLRSRKVLWNEWLDFNKIDVERSHKVLKYLTRYFNYDQDPMLLGASTDDPDLMSINQILADYQKEMKVRSELSEGENQGILSSYYSRTFSFGQYLGDIYLSNKGGRRYLRTRFFLQIFPLTLEAASLVGLRQCYRPLCPQGYQDDGFSKCYGISNSTDKCESHRVQPE